MSRRSKGSARLNHATSISSEKLDNFGKRIRNSDRDSGFSSCSNNESYSSLTFNSLLLDKDETRGRRSRNSTGLSDTACRVESPSVADDKQPFNVTEGRSQRSTNSHSRYENTPVSPKTSHTTANTSRSASSQKSTAHNGPNSSNSSYQSTKQTDSGQPASSRSRRSANASKSAESPNVTDSNHPMSSRSRRSAKHQTPSGDSPVRPKTSHSAPNASKSAESPNVTDSNQPTSSRSRRSAKHQTPSDDAPDRPKTSHSAPNASKSAESLNVTDLNQPTSSRSRRSAKHQTPSDDAPDRPKTSHSAPNASKSAESPNVTDSNQPTSSRSRRSAKHLTPSHESSTTSPSDNAGNYNDTEASRGRGKPNADAVSSQESERKKRAQPRKNDSADSAKILGRRRTAENTSNSPNLPHGNEDSGNKSVSIETTVKVYGDNSLSRKHDRVGKPVGTVVVNAKTGEVSEQFYVDNPLNRAAGRVGLPRGSKPVILSTHTNKIIDYIGRLKNGEKIEDSGDDSAKSAYEEANCNYEKHKIAESSAVSAGTFSNILSTYTGAKIPHSDIQCQVRIGRGGYGEVYYAKLKGTVVAVKRIRRDRGRYQTFVSKQIEEMQKCCSLEHPNIVRFLGACTELEHLSIIMEYMRMSLHDAIMIRGILFPDEFLLKIIKGICKGLLYIHVEAKMAHCDLKPQNILLDCEGDKLCVAKISDFGLSMSTTSSDTARRAGTPRYSAPEVLRGKSLKGQDMTKCDMYSLGVLLYEALFRMEHLCDVQRSQLAHEVCEKKRVPKIPAHVINAQLEGILDQSWRFKPDERPTIQVFNGTIKNVRTIYLK